MPRIIFSTEEERREANKRDKRNCYHKHKEVYTLISRRAYYNKCIKEKPEKTIYYVSKINEVNAEILRLRGIREEN